MTGLTKCITATFFLLHFFHIQEYKAQKIIPESFDARDQWPQCELVGEIRNQLNCSAEWAFAPVSTMSDRLCIQTRGGVQFKFSPQELITCCAGCGGCHYDQDSYILQAINFWRIDGLVSGGDYGDSFQGCRPYSESPAITAEIPVCERKCQNTYGKSYSEDKIFGKSYMFVTSVEDMQEEIMTNGPLLAGFSLYDDFLDYKNGVYERRPFSNHVGYSYLKILGWGTEGGKKYWLVANSWGTEWGMNGFAKFLRGENHMNIEGNVISVTVDFASSSSSLLMSWVLVFSNIFLIFVAMLS